MIESDQWLLWKATDNNQKIPRAPWETGDPLHYVDAIDPSNWVSLNEAKRWQSKLPQNFNLAYVLTRDDRIAFLDLDDVMIDGQPSPAAQEIIKKANSYTAISTSGTGIHIFVNSCLKDNIKSLTGPIDERSSQSLEVYDRNRFIAITGNHIQSTPKEIKPGDGLLRELEDKYASVSSGKPDQTISEPQQTRDELSDIETTSDVQDIFDAISQTRPSDITMRSTQTREHNDGTYSYDPSWVHSESGTRLGVLDDVWIYRKGMIALDALQLVALEEGIITDEQKYPEGSDFWEAVDILRSRGAHIPEFDPGGEPITEIEETDSSAEIDRWQVAKNINYGKEIRTHIHPYDRSYQEELALDLTPVLIDAIGSLHLSPTVAYRAAELYAKGHAAGIVPGAAHESSLGAAIRIAAIVAGTPRPLPDISSAVEQDPSSVRNKFQRIIRETSVSEALDVSDLVVDPADYVPYVAQQLGVADSNTLRDSVCDLLAQNEYSGGSNPISEVGAAFYVAMRQSNTHSVTQEDVAHAAGVSEVTIRNNYEKYTE
jgi:transcription initiation factor TFIIIB Brf1 subunit/transcription initiation factor TFIIB